MPMNGYQDPYREAFSRTAEGRVARRAKGITKFALKCLNRCNAGAAGVATENLAEKSPEDDRNGKDPVSPSLGLDKETRGNQIPEEFLSLTFAKRGHARCLP
jgi:hypothetical protein